MKNIILIICCALSYIGNAQQIITTIAGSGPFGPSGLTGSFGGDGGPATNALLFDPVGIILDSTGNIYFTDSYNMRIRKIDTYGIISTIGGNGTYGFAGEDTPATDAAFSGGIAYLGYNKGKLYIPDYNYSYIRIINAGDTVKTIAGNGICGNTGNGGFAATAEVCSPVGVTFDKTGNLYLCDESGSIRKIDTAGIIKWLGGKGVNIYGYSGDLGPADSAIFNAPLDLAVDGKGNMYITDGVNNKIRKIDTSGIITTYAGADTLHGYSGDNGPATAAHLFIPEGITIDDIGNIFFSDCDNFVVRKIDTAGIISTVVGNGTEGYSGDDGPATAAQLDKPAGLAFDKEGNLYIADWLNNRIRKVTNVGTMLGVPRLSPKGGPMDCKVYPNPANTLINFQFSTAVDATIKITNIEGQILQTVQVNSATMATLNVASYPPGMYVYQVVTKAETQVGKVVKE